MKRTPITFAAAFSLVEVLAAMVVFALMATLTSQIIGQTSLTTTLRVKRISAIANANTVLDLLANDLGNVVTQGGASLVGGVNNGGSKLMFLCRSRPDSANEGERMSLVCYHRRAMSGSPVEALYRDTRSVTWADTEQSFVDLLAATPSPGEDVAIAEGIVGFNVAWLGKDGSFRQMAGDVMVDLREIRGFTVTLAALDTHTLRALSSEAEGLAATLAAAFLVPDDDQLPAEHWKAAVAALNDSRLSENIRIIQRSYYLPMGGLR